MFDLATGQFQITWGRGRHPRAGGTGGLASQEELEDQQMAVHCPMGGCRLALGVCCKQHLHARHKHQ